MGFLSKVFSSVFGGGTDKTAKAMREQNRLAKQASLLNANSDTSNVTQYAENPDVDPIGSVLDSRRKKRPTGGYGVNPLEV